jgi:hypothetical protein
MTFLCGSRPALMNNDSDQFLENVRTSFSLPGRSWRARKRLWSSKSVAAEQLLRVGGPV